MKSEPRVPRRPQLQATGPPSPAPPKGHSEPSQVSAQSPASMRGHRAEPPACAHPCSERSGVCFLEVLKEMRGCGAGPRTPRGGLGQRPLPLSLCDPSFIREARPQQQNQNHSQTALVVTKVLSSLSLFAARGVGAFLEKLIIQLTSKYT